MMLKAILVLVPFCFALNFTQGPTATDQGNQITIAFTVDEYGPVTVEVMNDAGKVIRHIGSGVLGGNAPLPFARNSLSQTLTWDKNDDLGNPVIGNWDVRVGLGLVASFDRFYGWSPKDIIRERFSELAVDTAGNLLLKGWNQLVMFDSAANYVRTLIPYPGDLPEYKLRGYGRIQVPGGRNLPLVYENSLGVIVRNFWSYNNPIAVTPQGTVVITTSNCACVENYCGHCYADKRRIGFIGLDGSCDRDSVLGPAAGFGSYSTAYFEVSPDGRYAYSAANGAAVYRVLLDSKDNSTPFLSGLTTAHGMGTDSAGNLYVADSAANAVKVFTSAGAAIRTIPATAPDRVRVNRRTGEIYVLSRVRLSKYSPLPDADSLYSVAVPGGVNMDVDYSQGNSRIWVIKNGSDAWAATCYRDNGAALALIAGRTVNGAGNAWSPSALGSGRTPSVNPDETFATMGGLWSRCRLNLSTGQSTQSGNGNEAAYGPNGYLYEYGNPADSCLTVYNAAGAFVRTIHGQANYFISGVTTRGLAAGLNGDIYIPQNGRTGNPAFINFDVYGADGTLKTDNVIACTSPSFYPFGGIQVDPRGNLFIYGSPRPRGVTYPAVFQGQLPDPEVSGSFWPYSRVNYYLMGIGSIFKFPPSGGSIRWRSDLSGISTVPAGGNCDGYNVPQLQVSSYYNRTYEVQGAIWQYHGMYVSGLLEDGECECSSGRFCVDLFGRVMVPEAMRFSVLIMDNNKNPMLRFGDYGNADQLGAGSSRPDPAIPLNFPTQVASVNRSVYVMDKSGRYVRVRLSYPVEWSRNDGLVTGSQRLIPAAFRDAVSVYPFPASAGVTMAVNLEKRGLVSVAVYSPDGRLVKAFKPGTLGAGVHGFTWDGSSEKGGRSGSGLYVARVNVGKRTYSRNILVLR